MKTPSLCLIIFALSAPRVFAFALGEIELSSYHNEPLEARIPLIQFSNENIESVNIRIADRLAFANAGIPRTESLDKLQITLKQDTAHGKFIHLTSKDSIKELYLDFILDISTHDKRLSKNITVLIDPRDYGRLSGKPRVAKRHVSHSMEVTINHRKDSHSMESHSMEATVDHGKESHSMESHSMEATVDHGKDSHSMESHSMEATVNHGKKSHSMESHSMEATVDHGKESHSMESHSMESHSSL